MTPHAISLPQAQRHISTGSAADFDDDIAGLGDLESLCRLVIGRHERLNLLVELGASEIIVRNEKRMLHAAMDALLEDDEIALTVAHFGIDTFATYLAYIAEVDIDMSPVGMTAPTYAA